MGYFIEIDLGDDNLAVDRLDKITRFCLHNDMMDLGDVRSCLEGFVEIEAYPMCNVLSKIITDKNNLVTK